MYKSKKTWGKKWKFFIRIWSWKIFQKVWSYLLYFKLFWSKGKFIVDYLDIIELNIEGENFVGIVMEFIDGKVCFWFVFN
jgi:hypothetical protein